MKNIFKLDLRKFNNEKLKEVCDKYLLDYDKMLSNKKKGYANTWIDNDLGIVVAFTTKKDSTIVYTHAMDNFLSSAKEVEIIKQPRELDLDSILEKISKYGIDSLKDDEKEFLDNLSK
jgi:hypothetical protein